MFITVEGVEGGGKTLQSRLLSGWLDARDIDHLLTKEPGTIISKECRQIRELILNPENDIAVRAEMFLYLADRSQHVEKCILPALVEGKWVISDRYLDSTKVYQGVGRKLGIETITPMIEYASHGLMPDLTFILDLPAEIGIKRARESNTEFKGGDRIEREDMSFHESLREGFLELAKTHSRYVVLDATQRIEELYQQIIGIVRKKEQR